MDYNDNNKDNDNDKDNNNDDDDNDDDNDDNNDNDDEDNNDDDDDDNDDNDSSSLRRPCLPASDATATAATAPPPSCRSCRATTMPMHMTAAMKTQFIEYADKKKQDFVTVRQKQKETKESDLNFLEEWAFPTPRGICAPAMFNCTEIPESLKIWDRVYACLHGPKGGGRGWHLAKV
jgi:hypothetical protein